MTWQEDIISNAERQIEWAQSQIPGRIGGVAARLTCDLGELPLEMLGEHPPTNMGDRHRVYEEEFNALAAVQLAAGRVTQDQADQAMSDFHTWLTRTRFQSPQTSPHFYD